MEDCIFCKIINRSIPSYTVYQDDRTLAFLDINPNTLGHTLVVPKTHVETILDISEIDLEAVFRTVRKVVRGIEATIHPEGFNFVVNQGAAAGQVIPHFHCHITPRSSNDGIEFNVTGITLTPEEFRDLSADISRKISQEAG